MPVQYTLSQLADYVGGLVIGDAGATLDSVAPLDRAGSHQISFLSGSSYRRQLAQTAAGAVILNNQDARLCPVNALVVENPYAAYARIASLLNPEYVYDSGVDSAAHVSASAQLAKTASIAAGAVIEDNVVVGEYSRIGPGCVIQRNAQIGDHVTLTSNVTIAHDCSLGNRVLIHAGAVIGADGFGQAFDNGKWIKVPQLGRVVIGNDVEIGANTTIDRGALDDTIIEDNVKLDNLIQVAHNVTIGAHTAIAACSAIAGSTKIGKHCRIAGMVGIVGHLDIADNVMVTAMSLVTKSIKQAGAYSSGTPLEPNQQWHRNSIRFKQLDDMAKRLRALEKKTTEE